MSTSAIEGVVAHWSTLVESFGISPKTFYAEVQKALERRRLPDSALSRVNWKENGILSAQREYLRVSRDRLVVDVCSAPFGTGAFFSAWTAETRASLWPLVFTLALAICCVLLPILVTILSANYFGQSLLPVVGSLAGAGSILLFVVLMRGRWWPLAEALFALPYLGPLLENLFRPPTYYQVDTTLMFQKAVHAAIMEALDAVTTAKGIKPLSELERKPIMSEFFRK